MSRQPKDFSKGKIYCIRNNIHDDIYIGSTCQSLSQRMAQHRLDKRRERNQNRFIYKLMNEVDDDSMFYIELMEEYPCQNKDQLRKREGELIRELEPKLNMQVECRTSQEYREFYKEFYTEYNRRYYQENKEYYSECNKKNYEKRKDEINQHRKVYRENNRDKIHQKQKEWYDNNKEEKNRKSREHYNANKERISERRKELKALKKQLKEN